MVCAMLSPDLKDLCRTCEHDDGDGYCAKSGIESDGIVVVCHGYERKPDMEIVSRTVKEYLASLGTMLAAQTEDYIVYLERRCGIDA